MPRKLTSYRRPSVRVVLEAYLDNCKTPEEVIKARDELEGAKFQECGQETRRIWTRMIEKRLAELQAQTK